MWNWICENFRLFLTVGFQHIDDRRYRFFSSFLFFSFQIDRHRLSLFVVHYRRHRRCWLVVVIFVVVTIIGISQLIRCITKFVVEFLQQTVTLNNSDLFVLKKISWFSNFVFKLYRIQIAVAIAVIFYLKLW